MGLSPFSRDALQSNQRSDTEHLGADGRRRGLGQYAGPPRRNQRTHSADGWRVNAAHSVPDYRPHGIRYHGRSRSVDRRERDPPGCVQGGPPDNLAGSLADSGPNCLPDCREYPPTGCRPNCPLNDVRYDPSDCCPLNALCCPGSLPPGGGVILTHSDSSHRTGTVYQYKLGLVLFYDFVGSPLRGLGQIGWHVVDRQNVAPVPDAVEQTAGFGLKHNRVHSRPPFPCGSGVPICL